MASNNNYTAYTFWLALIVIVILFGISLVPGWNVGDIALKRTNIVSEIIEFGDESPIESMCDSLTIDSAAISKPMDSTACVKSAIKEQTWSISNGVKVETRKVDTDSSKNTESEILSPIEDYAATESPHAMNKFYSKLASGKRDRPIRIAVIGDSFVEGDIFSADIRELLQRRYAGSGPGFVPTSSPVAQYRGTVKHTFNGWNSHSILKAKSAPQSIKDRFFVSGLVATPQEGAKVRYEGVKFKNFLNSWTNTRLLFINEQKSQLNITINDSVTRVFNPESSPNLQHINIEGEIHSIALKVTNPEGFISYGAVLDSESGVSVDNYALRGNSGLSLISANTTICRQFNEILDYDLVVLQYGLNVMSASVTNYNNYAMQMSRVVDHIKNCFPNSAIMVLGVSDRSIQKEGAFETMPTLQNLLSAQRGIARKSEVAFWSIYDAMGGHNSMVKFVAKGWGAKDYTHISYAGGKYIAQEFVGSLLKGKEDHISKREKTEGGLEYTLSLQTK